MKTIVTVVVCFLILALLGSYYVPGPVAVPDVVPEPTPARPDWCAACDDFTAPIGDCSGATQSDGGCMCKLHCE